MRAFIASVEDGYGDRRDAAAAAVRSVDGEVVRAEGLSPPQQACLAAVRQSDVVVLVLGATYGAQQSFGLSATHEEWKEAQQEGKPVLAFIENVEESQRDPLQIVFVQQVEDWTGGHFGGVLRLSSARILTARRRSPTATAGPTTSATRCSHDCLNSMPSEPPRKPVPKSPSPR